MYYTDGFGPWPLSAPLFHINDYTYKYGRKSMVKEKMTDHPMLRSSFKLSVSYSIYNKLNGNTIVTKPIIKVILQGLVFHQTTEKQVVS